MDENVKIESGRWFQNMSERAGWGKMGEFLYWCCCICDKIALWHDEEG